jgi:DNA-binding beta-propeller fold protein YncE
MTPTPSKKRTHHGVVAMLVVAVLVVAVLVVAMIAAACAANRPVAQRSSDPPLPLRAVGEVALPGDNSRFDYSSLDKQRGLLFIAHLGASEVVEVDVAANRVVRTIPNLEQVHGVLVVGPLNRVYATATGANQVVALDETTGAELGRAPTGAYPDGLDYDPRRNTIWTTNESAGTETVVDAATMQPRGDIEVGGQVGNVGYDQDSDRMLVAVGARNDLAVIDPAAMTVVQRVALPGCDHPHGLSVGGPDRLVFVACESNATLVTVDQTHWNILGTNPVGEDPDVLAYDSAAHRLYVAAESGTVKTLDLHDRTLAVSGSGHLADNAHVVAVDPNTHRSYYPVPSGSNGHPALLERQSS